MNASQANVTGRYPIINATAIGEFLYYNISTRSDLVSNVCVDTTDLAAVAAWEVLQGFYSALPQLDSKVQSTQFNLWTER